MTYLLKSLVLKSLSVSLTVNSAVSLSKKGESSSGNGITSKKLTF